MKHHVTHSKKTNLVEETVDKIPDFRKFGRAVKLRLNPHMVPNLGWEYEAAEVSTIACMVDAIINISIHRTLLTTKKHINKRDISV